MHYIYDCFHIIHGRVLQDAVTEIKDVTRSAVRAAQNIMHARFEFRVRREERDGVKIPLHGDIISEQSPAIVKWDAPVESDHVTTRAFHQRQQRCRVRSKMDDGHVHRLRGFE